MKKQIIISSAIAASILVGTTVVVLNDVRAENSANEPAQIATNSTLPEATSPVLSSSKDETVYVITDASGVVKSKFIGNTLYSGTKELPFNFKITYYLDGAEISAKDLKGKSGHVKIVYSYDSTAKYLGRNVPFVALTGLTLDRANFSNLKLENGKIVTETNSSYILAGYSITGLNQNLGTDFLPDSFTLEADVKDFELKDSYTIFTNDLIADIDTSKLNSIDSIISSVYQLSDGFDQIIAGTNKLSDGLSSALNGTKELYAGSIELVDGLNSLVENNDALQYGANTITSTILDTINEVISLLNSIGIETEYDVATIDNYQAVYASLVNRISVYKEAAEARIDEMGLSDSNVAALIKNTFNKVIDSVTGIKSLVDFSQGVIAYTDGVAKVAAGATRLSAGLGSLVNGQTELYNGSVTLKDGLTTFKTSGIDKLVNFAANDLNNFIINLKGSVSAASSYHNFGNTDAKSVKFIIKSPSI